MVIQASEIIVTSASLVQANRDIAASISATQPVEAHGTKMRVTQPTMHNLSEDIFINIANLTLDRRDSYLDYLRAGVKKDTLTALQNATLHMHSLFPDQLLMKVQEEVSLNEERCPTGTSQKKPSRYHPYASSAANVPAWKQIRDS